MEYKEFCRGLDAAAAQYPAEKYNCLARINVVDW
jgi:hypothetical protein